MLCRPFTQISDRGFTLVELLVALGVSLAVVGMALATSIAQKRLYAQDAVRTRVNSDLRSIMAIMNVNVRQAGESLPGSFPAVEIIDGGSGPDELVLRRNLLDEVLKLCAPITSGSNNASLYFALTTSLAGCDFTSNTSNYNAWRAERIAGGGQVDAYIYDSVTDLGEYFQYQSEGTNSSTDYYIGTSGHTWTNSYSTTGGVIYILEEWHFSLNNGLLQLVENADTANPKNIADGISDFKLRAILQDGTIKTSFNNSDQWTDLQSIEITLQASETFAGQTIERSLTSKFFPRNVLSN